MELTELTEENIKSLMPGDSLIIHGRHEAIVKNENILVSFYERYSGQLIKVYKSIHRSQISLPSNPKYNPNRLFKKGDIVEPKVVNGRPAIGRYEGTIVEIPSEQYIVSRNESENENHLVSIFMSDGTECDIDPAYLELLVPAEGRTCATCTHFHRTSDTTGMCYIKPTPFSEVVEHETCKRHDLVV